jgi:hypothetical protein
VEIFEGLLAGFGAGCRDFPSGYRGKVRNSMVEIGFFDGLGCFDAGGVVLVHPASVGTR